MPTPATIPNQGAMNGFIKPFTVASKLTDQTYHVWFSHLWNGIATRHSDSVDTKFLVDGRSVVIGLAHTAFISFQTQHGRGLTDREAAFIAAAYLRERLEQEDEQPLFDVHEADVLRLAEAIGLH
jgi:hypothetical protein